MDGGRETVEGRRLGQNSLTPHIFRLTFIPLPNSDRHTVHTSNTPSLLHLQNSKEDVDDNNSHNRDDDNGDDNDHNDNDHDDKDDNDKNDDSYAHDKDDDDKWGEESRR